MLTTFLALSFDLISKAHASMTAQDIRFQSCQSNDILWSSCVADITGLAVLLSGCKSLRKSFN